MTVPAVVAAAALVWSAAPALVPLALLVDVAGRRTALTRTYAMLMVTLACECLGLAALATLGVASLLGLSRRRARAASFALQCWWVGTLARSILAIFGMRLVVEGAERVGDGPVLVLMRHVSSADTLLPGLLISGPRRIVLRYVLKHELLWDPCLDIVGHQLDGYFVRRGVRSEQEIAAVARLADGLGEEGVVLYPEGTRFTPGKRARILARLEAAGDAVGLARARELTHVLPPRHGGPVALLERARGVDVLLCAHTGFEGATTFASLLRGRLVGAVVRVRFWRVPAGDVPEGRDAKIAWLHAQWVKVNAFVADRH